MGKRMSILHKGLVLIAIPLLFQLVLLAIHTRVMRGMAESRDAAMQALKVDKDGEQIYRLLADAQNSVRGFVITEDEKFLHPFEASMAALPALIEKFERAPASEQQAERLTRILSLARERIAEMDLQRRLIRAGKRQLAIDGIKGGFGFRTMPAVRQEMSDFLVQQTLEAEKRQQELEKAHQRQNTWIFFAFIVSLSVALITLYLFSAGISSRLGVVSRNAERLKEGRELLPPLEGSDEIAGVDHTFRVMAAALQRQTAELVSSNRELQNFAAVASHDLQEPLRKIEAFGDRLRVRYADTLGEQGQDYLNRIFTSAKRMRSLIDDLLAFSRVTTRVQAMKPIELDVIAQEVVRDLETRLEQTGGRVELGPLPTLAADPTQMRQLLQNLIGNALKFRKPETAPIVTVQGESFEDPATRLPMVRLIIRDNGIGFEPQYADRIFGLFQRLHGREAYEGTGMGLAICRRIVERHGGTIAAESKPGEGAAFLVTLPQNPPQESPLEQAVQVRHHSHG